MNIKNKDVIKRLGTRNLAKILGCSESTINSWTKKGLGRTQLDLSTFNDIAQKKVNSFKLEDVFKWLKDSKKEKYLIKLEDYLNKDYICNICRDKIATVKNEDYNNFLCKDCNEQCR